MRKNTIKLNQIISPEDIQLKFRSQIHKVSNSLKRNTTHQSLTQERQDQYYQCRLPDVGFTRKDLSLVLRYILSKQLLQIGDRNLLRRILLSHFEEQIIIAGTKKFIHFLRLIEGHGKLTITQTPQFYFLLKGTGTAHSGSYQYPVHPGSIFGEIQILLSQPLDHIQFQSNYLLLSLQQKDFETFFKNYYQTKYQNIETKLICIQQTYLHKIPEKARYLFLKTIYEKQFTQGQTISKKNNTINQIYFINQNQQSTKNNNNHNCPGLHQTIQSQTFYSETIICAQRKLIIPCAKVTDFQQYVLKSNNISIEGKSSLFSEHNLSYLSLNFNEKVNNPKLNNFMRVKKVKLSHVKSRLKTEPTDYSETSFKFLKPDVCSSFYSRKQRANRSELTKTHIRYNSVLSRYNN